MYAKITFDDKEIGDLSKKTLELAEELSMAVFKLRNALGITVVSDAAPVAEKE